MNTVPVRAVQSMIMMPRRQGKQAAAELFEAANRMAATFGMSLAEAEQVMERVAAAFRGYNQFHTNHVRVRHIITSQRKRRHK